MEPQQPLRIGFLINPYSGIGGALALKGSDDIALEKLPLLSASDAIATLPAISRATITLKALHAYNNAIHWLAAPSIMGAELLEHLGFNSETIGDLKTLPSSSADTERLAREILNEGVDLLLFAGGDGTACDIVKSLSDDQRQQQLCLGIPTGVKMHSGVYAVSPEAAARVMIPLIGRDVVSVAIHEVRDIDEEALRNGRLNSKYFGELQVPDDQRYVQQVKNTGRQNEEEIQAEIAASIVDDMDNESLYIIGCGTTPRAVMDELGLPNTLLGIDVLLGRELIAADVTAEQLEGLLDSYSYHKVYLLLTAIGGQGHIIGRGNQQLTPRILRRVGRANIRLLITPSKLSEFEKRPLLMDSGDPDLDSQWQGLITVVVGYQQSVVYPLNFV